VISRRESEDAAAEGAIDRDLPLLVRTRDDWARLAAEQLDVFLSDHAVCEQQAALTALNLVAHYPEDAELIDRMTSLAAEEVMHLRRVARLLHRRGVPLAKRRPNRYVQRLHQSVRKEREQELKMDRLLVGALIEARSCERFTRLLEALRRDDADVAELLRDLGPAEKRHWEMFHGLAAREVDPEELRRRWRFWLELDRDLQREAGLDPTVHG
jgi:tRNA-(ms[2]io[6]A)-hydroxylase